MTDSCLENLKRKDGLASCSAGQGRGTVALLAACPSRGCGAKNVRLFLMELTWIMWG